MLKQKTHEEFIQEMKNINPELEFLSKYNKDNCKILVRHKNFLNHVWEATPSNLLKGRGCPFCSNRKSLKGFNTFGDYYPEFIELFENKDEPFNYTYGSGKEVEVICPNCKEKRKIKLNDLRENGFSCKVCGDSVSIPNKFIRNIILLNKDKLEEFDFEYSPKWAKIDNKHRYFYDCYFKINNKTYIVEMNGIQHKTNKWANKQIKNVDKEKEILAKQNKIDFYIVIDADFSNLDYLRKNFEKTILFTIFQLTEEDWIFIGKKMNSSLMIEVCNFYNSNKEIGLKDIADFFKISRITVGKYLKQGNKLGLCCYNSNKHQAKVLSNILQNKNSYNVQV